MYDSGCTVDRSAAELGTKFLTDYLAFLASRLRGALSLPQQTVHTTSCRIPESQ